MEVSGLNALSSLNLKRYPPSVVPIPIVDAVNVDSISAVFRVHALPFKVDTVKISLFRVDIDTVDAVMDEPNRKIPSIELVIKDENDPAVPRIELVTKEENDP